MAHDAKPVGGGGGQSLLLAQDVPSGLAEASSLLCTSSIYRLGKGRSLREFPFIAGTPRLQEGMECMCALRAPG